MGGNGAARPVRVDRRNEEPALVDRRWLLLAALVFGVAIGGFSFALWVYHATGPHPETWVFVHHLRHVARWLLPRWSHHWYPA